MKTLARTKLLGGTHIELRSYELFKDKIKLFHCLNKKPRKCNHVGEQYMILTVAQQKKGKVVNTQQSKFYPYKNYLIYKFLWKPIGTEQSIENQWCNE